MLEATETTQCCCELLAPVNLDFDSLSSSTSIVMILVDGAEVHGDGWNTFVLRVHDGELSSGGKIALSLFAIDRRPGIDFTESRACATIEIETFPSLLVLPLPIGIGPSLRIRVDATKGVGSTRARVSAALVRR